jgi:hypothetical protein
MISLDDLRVIAPEIVGVERLVNAVRVRVKVGDDNHPPAKVGGAILLQETPTGGFNIIRTIDIADSDLMLVGGQEETIDLIRAAVEACKLGASVFHFSPTIGRGKERELLVNQRLHGKRTAAKTIPPLGSLEYEADPDLVDDLVSDVKPAPPPERFTENDDDFASRLRAKVLK